ncbi:TatA/E family twin arginine-targeting protein translocase [Nodosilinea sp. LEGE 06152]|uniref:TatA/E family twin arginine-targeting protein translocase n=1 Tax=Nodosilinea sp. LEGE 06152 TaxID=2777966 RepID=UPI00187EA287|nr:TatA/E family twin arginine-targeting protein translocase [Nodosilinea sp. LEGE 06152]MBE9157976.1 TatA/E family twin arginine-targeting protein translocase [Nodosilinea sp. LEGE 06152]
MNVFGVGLPEMALILVLALLVFGPKKLPEIGRSLGKAIKGFQDASREFEEEFKKEAQQIEKAVTTPMKATLEPESQKVLTPPDAAADAELTVAETPVEVSDTNGSSPEESAETNSPT